MLVTISGIVGSGKTTVTRRILRDLETLGTPATYLRFQSLPCFALFRRTGPAARGPDVVTSEPAAAGTDVRGTGHRRRVLTMRATLIYVARAVAFRIFRRRLRRDRWSVSNRYFYDYLAHYRLTSRRERFYLSAIRFVVPVPDVAILLTASEETIAERRPLYAAAYIRNVTAGYAAMRARFPELVELRTDGSVSAEDAAVQILRMHSMGLRAASTPVRSGT